MSEERLVALIDGVIYFCVRFGCLIILVVLALAILLGYLLGKR